MPPSETERRFPVETNTVEVRIESNKVISIGQLPHYNFEINIETLEAVYYKFVDFQGSNLILLGGAHRLLLTSATGFPQVYESLSAKLGLNDDVFFKTVHEKISQKITLWKKIKPSTYRLTESEHSDYELGFEILAPKKSFIDWDTPYVELIKNPHAFIEKGPYNQKKLKFKYPVRIGNIVVTQLSSYLNSREDVPPLQFSAECIHESNTDKSYYELKERFFKDFTPENQHLKYEHESQNSFEFDARGMTISILYSYETIWGFDRGDTSLGVKNMRDYPDLLIDEDYESKIEISEMLEISEPVKVSGHYKSSKRVKRRPPIIKSEFTTVWIDKKNGKIGFADHLYSQVIDIDDIEYFTISNVQPARGSGGTTLRAQLKDESLKYNTVALLYGKYQALDVFYDRIKWLTGLRVVMAPEGRDD